MLITINRNCNEHTTTLPYRNIETNKMQEKIPDRKTKNMGLETPIPEKCRLQYKNHALFFTFKSSSTPIVNIDSRKIIHSLSFDLAC